MRHLVVVAVLLCLSACINVDDFGAYWNNGTVERALVGDWTRVPATPEQARDTSYGIGYVMHIAIKGDAYELTLCDPDGKEKDKPMYPARTLVVGPYDSLRTGRRKG